MGSTSVWVFRVIARLLIGHHEVFPRQHTKKIEIRAVTSWGLVLDICSLQVVALPLRKEPFIQADRGTNMASSAIYMYRYTHLQRIHPCAMCSVAVTVVPFRDVSPLLARLSHGSRAHPRFNGLGFVSNSEASIPLNSVFFH